MHVTYHIICLDWPITDVCNLSSDMPVMTYDITYHLIFLNPIMNATYPLLILEWPISEDSSKWDHPTTVPIPEGQTIKQWPGLFSD